MHEQAQAQAKALAQAHEEEVNAALGEALLETYSLYDIDDEPRVLRLWPTPTNHDVANDIAAFFE